MKINKLGCVYVAHCKVNGKKYVGKSIHGIVARKKLHLRDARNGSRFLFYIALRKHGEESFEWSVLYKSSSDRQLYKYERVFVKQLDSLNPNGYNLTEGGDGVKGYVVSEETKKKIGDSCRGRPRTEEAKKNISNALKGRPNYAIRGIPKSKETILKLKRALKNHPALTCPRRPLSEIHKKRISTSLKGHTVSKATRYKISKKVSEYFNTKRDLSR